MKQFKKSILLDRFLISLGILIFIRIGTFLPIPIIDHQKLIYFCKKNSKLKNFIKSTTGNNTLTIGIFTLNIFPYINASFFTQLITKIFPRILNIQKNNGQECKKMLIKLTRIFTLFISLSQSIVIVSYLKCFLPNLNIYLRSEIILYLTTGAMIILWLSEIITKYGLGNGPSLIIFTNIVSNFPKLFNNIYNQNFSVVYWLYILTLILLVICGLILLQEGTRLFH